MLEARIAPTPRDTVFRDGRGSLYRFRGSDRASARTHVPVVLVPSMINRWYVLDLREGASLASALSSEAPWETFCFDWGVPEDEDRYLGWDDVVERLGRVVRFVRRSTGASKVALVGYSMGATVSSIYAALHPGHVGALVDMAGPIDFAEAGRLGLLVDRRWFDADAMTCAGNLGAMQMQSGFLALAPTINLTKWVGFFEKAHDPAARAAFFALETWANDNVPFPAAAYATYVKELYQENQLVRGEHHVRGERVDLSRIRCPVLSVVAERDGICPAACVTALNRAVRSSVRDVLSVPGGHVGAFVGHRAAEELYPQMKQWLLANAALHHAAHESRL